MKLTFFEKDLFDRDAYEKPTISVNSQDTNQRELVKKIATPLSEGAFVSVEKNKSIRTIRIPAEYLDFFVDGSKSTGSFKHIKLTSGEPEIVSRTTAPQVTKPINVSFDVNARLRALEEDEPVTELQLNRLTYEPILSFRLGRAITIIFSRGLGDLRRLGNFLRGVYSSGFLGISRALTSFSQRTRESDMPSSLITKEYTNAIGGSITQGQVVRNLRLREYPGLRLPVREYQYWKVTGTIKNTIDVRDFALRGRSSSASIVCPVHHTLTYENPTVQWSNADGTPRNDIRSVYAESLFPSNVSSGSFYVSVNSTYRYTYMGRNVITDPSGNPAYQYLTSTNITSFRPAGDIGSRLEVYYAYVYSYVIQIQLRGYDSFFNLLRSGFSFANYFNQIRGAYGGGTLSVNFKNFGVRNEILDNLTSIQATLSIINPTGSARKNSHYILGQASDIGFYQRGDLDPPTKRRLDAIQLSRGLSLVDTIRSEVNSISQNYLGSRPPISIYEARPFVSSDFTSPTGRLTNSDLGFENNSVQINNVNQSNSISISPLNYPSSSTTNQDGSQYKNYFYRIVSGLNVNNARLITQDNFSDNTAPGTSELKSQLPINLETQGTDTYQIVDIDFNRNRISIMKNYGRDTINTNIRELTALSIEGTDGRVREVQLSSPTRGTFNNLPVVKYRSSVIVNYFRPVFNSSIRRYLANLNGVELPRFTAFIRYMNSSRDTLFNLLSTTLNRLRFILTAGTQSVTPDEATQDLLEDVNKSFPHVRLTHILYNTEENRIYLVLARSENSPVPDKRYFSSVKINRRSFNFSSSRYNAYTNPETSPYGSKVAEYSWSYPTNLLGTEQTIPIQFRKSGTSTTNAIDISRLVRKATVNTKDKKEYTEIINNLFVKDIGFTSTSFYIEFSGDIPTTRFQSIALKSQDNNEYITRQLLTTDATVTEDSGKTKFTWNDKPEFAILSYNKQYTIEMISGANAKEKRLFIPIQSKDNFHFVNNYKQTSGNISFNLQRSTFTDNLSKSFVAMALLKESDNSVISGGWYNSNRFIYDTDRKTFTLENSNIIDSPATGTKVLLSFQIQDRDLTEITLLKLTDIFFDTIICLDTNINDLNLLDNNGNPLAHPSDYETIKEVTEDGLRHIFLKLKQPITTKELKLLVRRTSDDANEIRINRMLVLKSIGCFSQYPEVTVNTNQSKTDESSAINTSHITSKPLSINYTLAFPPLTKEKDLSLAQDLFTRASEYNEFLIWVSGGDIAPKIKNLIGYRFIDIVKSLATNDFSVHYVDGRFSSGVDFTIETKQTARINI